MAQRSLAHPVARAPGSICRPPPQLELPIQLASVETWLQETQRPRSRKNVSMAAEEAFSSWTWAVFHLRQSPQWRPTAGPPLRRRTQAPGRYHDIPMGMIALSRLMQSLGSELLPSLRR